MRCGRHIFNPNAGPQRWVAHASRVLCSASRRALGAHELLRLSGVISLRPTGRRDADRDMRDACASHAQRGFTMVEIALSIAVVAFALVAILGVLPTGMTVQKDNRDDGVINQEGRYWLEAIRSGSRGLDDLTNYVESITVSNITTRKTVTFDNGIGGGAGLRPQDVIALLSTPKVLEIALGNNKVDYETNRVTARVKAITGPAAEKGPLTNEFSFRYEMQVEMTGNNVSLYSGTFPDIEAQRRYMNTLGNNLHELRLIFRWPVVQRGNGWFVGNNKKTFRARMAGSYQVETNATPNVANTFKSTLKTNLVVLAPNRFNVDAARTQ